MLNRRATRMMVFLLALGLSAGVSACATGAGGSSSSGPSRSANRITQEELADYTTLNALDAIRRLRPRWLQVRGDTPVAILDGARLGSPDALRSVAVSDVASMQYLSASDATLRYGTNFPAGAIEVRTRTN